MISFRLFVAFQIVGIVLVACSSPNLEPTLPPTDPPPTDLPPPSETPKPTEEPIPELIPITNLNDLAGTWLKSYAGFDSKLYIKPDGVATFSRQQDSGGRVVETWFDDGLLHFAEIPWPECPDGDIGIYEISGIPGEELRIIMVEDPCGNDRGLSGTWTEASSP